MLEARLRVLPQMLAEREGENVGDLPNMTLRGTVDDARKQAKNALGKNRRQRIKRP